MNQDLAVLGFISLLSLLFYIGNFLFSRRKKNDKIVFLHDYKKIKSPDL
ncbi:hypothetical protein N0M98_04260 [Paenibacillus doosanensis]|uniref:LPXTG cell wall anchor domain-containing protein n=1 Tax=Paenibacillus konkukensis TaxID=2020716 RepID=A0ABY4RY96_9BACL|nr:MULTISPECIES: hypothetical protein [Paenibacillus]MCS7459344.1 hypothetical protein [Paenibacillus doosanensis]UQZ87137.1 hypothetical protein SK3146_06433 [Paenibacillus konkukensis]